MNKLKLLGIPAGVLIVNVTEWMFHKYVLHGLGKKKGSFWSFHWYDHHKKVRKNEMIDDDYKGSLKELIGSKEALAIMLGSVGLAPLVTKLPFLITTMWICGGLYYLIHRKSHLDDNWAKKYVPWHRDHHFGKNQDANFCVMFPLTDYIMGTRIPT